MRQKTHKWFCRCASHFSLNFRVSETLKKVVFHQPCRNPRAESSYVWEKKLMWLLYNRVDYQFIYRKSTKLFQLELKEIETVPNEKSTFDPPTSKRQQWAHKITQLATSAQLRFRITNNLCLREASHFPLFRLRVTIVIILLLFQHCIWVMTVRELLSLVLGL